MAQLSYIVPDERAFQRLDRFLSQAPDLSSRSQIASWVREGRVLVNGIPAKPALKLRAGDVVEVDPPKPPPLELVPEEVSFKIVHEDEHLVVIDKPRGLSVHPGPGHPSGTLLNGLSFRGVRLSSIGLPLRPGVVHRIDLGTSGLLVLAKEDRIHRSLMRQFAKHTVDRQYLALVWGDVAQESGTIRSALGRSPLNRKKFASVETGGKPAVTHWKRLGGNGRITLLSLTLETGRTHQIRVHLSEMGHPVVGDPLYGRARLHGLSEELAGAVERLSGQLLHAATLGITHPVTNKRLCFESVPPADFEEVRRLAQIGA
ncbi:MAG: RluA family pseudouridine synthase [Bdellovibrionota bacterium]